MPGTPRAAATTAAFEDDPLAETSQTGLHLTRKNLAGTNVARANLTSANFTGSNVVNAYMQGADLTRADLTNADLTGSDPERRDLGPQSDRTRRLWRERQGH